VRETGIAAPAASVLASVSGGHVLSVNVGRPREFEWLGKRFSSAIWKSPVDGPVAARGVNLSGDDQADRSVHGGLDKAVYAYAREDARWWETELGREIDLGGFGENLTVEGIDVTGAVIGERWAIEDVLVEVSQPRIPCFKLGARMGDPDFPHRFAEGGRPGAYLRMLEEGELAAGARVDVVHRPAHRLTVGDVVEIYHRDHGRLAELLHAPELADGWKVWARKRMALTRA
jgi:MOSC domain-containing protein YiiM